MARFLARRTHATHRLIAPWLLAGCLSACSQPAPPPVAGAVAVAVRPSAPTPARAHSNADADLAAAVARDDAARADREQTLRVQQALRDQQRAREAARQVDTDLRCLAGQRMRRVANGWVQAGQC